MKLNIGKLYQIKQYFWLLYATKDIAAWVEQALDARKAVRRRPTRKDSCCLSPNDIFYLIEEDGNFLKVLSPNGEIGWMIFPWKYEPNLKDCIEEVIE